LAAGMVAAVALPWGYGVVAWSKDARASGAIGPTSFAPAAVLLVISAAAVATAALLHERFPRGLWLGAAAIVCTFWFTLLIEWLVVAHDADAASRAFQSVSGKPAYASLGNAGGAWLMLACCCGVYAWVAWQTVRLVRSRNSLPPAASSMPTGGPVAPW
jgi:hypothetical protein